MNISLNWADYAFIVGACLIVYYLVVGFVYFRKELSSLPHAKEDNRLAIATTPDSPGPEPEGLQDVNISGNQAPEEILSTDDQLPDTGSNVQDFVEEINAYTEAWGKETNKEELKEGFHKILHKYPVLKDSTLRNIFNGFISTVSQDNCSIHWSEDELNELWNG